MQRAWRTAFAARWSPGPPFRTKKCGGKVCWTCVAHAQIAQRKVEGEGGTEDDCQDDGELCVVLEHVDHQVDVLTRPCTYDDKALSAGVIALGQEVRSFVRYKSLSRLRDHVQVRWSAEKALDLVQGRIWDGRNMRVVAGLGWGSLRSALEVELTLVDYRFTQVRFQRATNVGMHDIAQVPKTGRAVTDKEIDKHLQW